MLARSQLVRWSQVAAFALGVAHSPSARAYCRLTTIHEPAGYDPTASGCWRTGTPLTWREGSMGYSLVSSASKDVTLTDATRVAGEAFAQWMAAECPSGAPSPRPQFVIRDDGPVDPGAGGANEIVFRDDGWPHSDPGSTLALTTLTFLIDTGEITGAQTEVNSHDHVITADEKPPSGAFSLRTILTHEAGHFLGMAHSEHNDAVMYLHYRDGANALTQDDVDGICSTYAYAAPAVVGDGGACALSRGRAGSAGTALAGAGIGLLALLARRRRA